MNEVEKNRKVLRMIRALARQETFNKLSHEEKLAVAGAKHRKRLMEEK